MNKAKILLVDDIEDNLVALEALLRGHEVEIIAARSASEALELILQHEFCLALIDVQMPEMDGFELAELMRGMERSKYIPIIFVTAGGHDAQRVFRGYETGAVDFLFKPVDPNILRHKVNTFVRLDTQKRLLAEQYARLQDSEAVLKEAVQAREDVMAVVSHDIRNFLFAIRTGNYLLINGGDKLNGEARAAIHARIGKTVDLMTRMISDLVDMANIRAGRISVTLKPEILSRMIADAVSVHEPLAHDKKIELSAELPAGDAVVMCDRERIMQVFANLVGNAIKFCGEGARIRIETQAAAGNFQLCVRDNGPGIAAADLPNVFNPYFSAYENRRTGTGLGLYITRSIVEAHGGRIWIESEIGRGTSVCFELPRG